MRAGRNSTAERSDREVQLAARTEAMDEPGFYRQDAAAVNAANKPLAELQAELDTDYARWQALDD
jgi:ATP-binding cassette subfamily F protein uup